MQTAAIRCLVSGATGLVGSHLVKHLALQGYAVRAMYRDAARRDQTQRWLLQWAPPAVFDAIEWVQADLNDIGSLQQATQNINTIVHAAGSVGLTRSAAQELRRSHIEGTANLINTALSQGVVHFIHISSIAASGPAGADGKVNEQTEWNPQWPNNDYAICKYGAEMEVWRGHYEGLSTCILRPGVILAEGLYHLSSAQIWNQAQKNRPWYPTGQTAWTDIQQLEKAISDWMRQPQNGCLRMVITSNASFREVLGHMASLLGGLKPHKALPYRWALGLGLLWQGVAWISGRRAWMDAYAIRSMYQTHSYHSLLAEPYPSTLEGALQRISQHFKQQTSPSST